MRISIKAIVKAKIYTKTITSMIKIIKMIIIKINKYIAKA